MFFLRRWIELWRHHEEERLYNTIMKVEERKSAAEWHVFPKCRFCQKALLIECQFCPHCGTDLTERHTTAQVRLVDMSLSEMSPITPTSVLRKYIQGDSSERPLRTLYKSGWHARDEGTIRHENKG